MKIILIHVIVLFLSFSAIANRIINVKDFGAKADGLTDDTKSIQAAIDDASPLSLTIIYFPPGIYNIASYTRTNIFLINYCLILHSNLYIKGDGDASIVRLADHLFDKTDTAATAHLFYGTGVKNINFSGLMIDMNGSNNLVPPKVFKNNASICAYGGENYHIHNITIKNCSGTNMLDIMRPGENITVENCKFINGGNYVGTAIPNKNQIDFSFVYSEWGHTIIKNNFIEQQNVSMALENYTGGIELHGNNSSAENNYIKGCWPGMYITSIISPLKNISVKNNTFSDCVSGISFYVNHPISNVLIENNNIKLIPAKNSKNDFCVGIRVPNGNIKEYSNELANLAPIYNLKIIHNTIDADSMATLSMGMLLHSLHGCVISGNIIKRMNYGGIVLQGSKWGTDSLLVEKNSFINFRRNYHPTAVAGYIIITDTYSPGLKDAPGFKNVLFRKNKFIRSINNRYSGLGKKNSTGRVEKENFYGAFLALPQKMIEGIKFKDNKFTISSEGIKIVKIDD